MKLYSVVHRGFLSSALFVGESNEVRVEGKGYGCGVGEGFVNGGLLGVSF